MNIDNEWLQFLDDCNNNDDFPSMLLDGFSKLSLNNKDNDEDDNDDSTEETISTQSNSTESLSDANSEVDESNQNKRSSVKEVGLLSSVPNPQRECEELYISTQTKIFFLNQTNLDVQKIFWNTNIIPYSTAKNGVIKKQIRFICKTREEFDQYEELRKKEDYYTEKIMKQIDNPNARKIKFKDVRKLTVGISKKDIMNCHGKNKNAFINCFAMILRVKQGKIFHEIHVKVFNTGRMAIPGIVNDELLENTKTLLLSILQPNFTTNLELITEDESPEVFRLVKGKKNKENNKKRIILYRKNNEKNR